jgi:hypothetical protein
MLVLGKKYSQVEEYGPAPTGKHRKSRECGSSIPAGKFSDFFPVTSCEFWFFPSENGRKSLEKIRKFPGRTQVDHYSRRDDQKR